MIAREKHASVRNCIPPIIHCFSVIRALFIGRAAFDVSGSPGVVSALAMNRRCLANILPSSASRLTTEDSLGVSRSGDGHDTCIAIRFSGLRPIQYAPYLV